MRTTLTFVSALAVLALIAHVGAAQTPPAADVQSVDGIVKALYEVISGEAGQPRDWVRFQNLFAADARLIPTRKDAAGNLHPQALSPSEYVTLFKARIPNGFFERELGRRTETYGTVTHVFSTYETQEKKDGPVTNRGINSIQLFYDGQRYSIVTIFWCAESMGFPLPAHYIDGRTPR
ncbi:MAG: hypothetical protein MUC38_08120 [Cyclobacteriaceae bacterium]|jgi:hypothetical protein|nr:hypothetical protein [Cyclobacteriaceae bacterium]